SKILVMGLNTYSEYFKEKIKENNSYFRKIKQRTYKNIERYISKYYLIVKKEYFLGISGTRIFDTSDRRLASILVILGEKREC
ncbi:MAG: hypothetical protein ACTSQY_02890, partial [Candidatus Odinarchaeia archaeon]